jgi:hypothetical protein
MLCGEIKGYLQKYFKTFYDSGEVWAIDAFLYQAGQRLDVKKLREVKEIIEGIVYLVNCQYLEETRCLNVSVSTRKSKTEVLNNQFYQLREKLANLINDYIRKYDR